MPISKLSRESLEVYQFRYFKKLTVKFEISQLKKIKNNKEERYDVFLSNQLV